MLLSDSARMNQDFAGKDPSDHRGAWLHIKPDHNLSKFTSHMLTLELRLLDLTEGGVRILLVDEVRAG